MQRIDKIYLKSFWLTLGIISLIFSFYMVTFILGNHDSPFIRFGTYIDRGFFEGRFTQFLLPWFFLDNHVLPIINVFLGLILYLAAVVLLAWFWKVPRQTNIIVLFSLLIIINPYIWSQFYYVHQIFPILCWFLFNIGGCILIYYGHFVFGGLLLITAVCGYAASVQTIAVVLLGRLLIDICEKESSFKELFVKYLKIGLIFLGVVFAYWLLLKWLKQVDIVSAGVYNVQILSALDIIQRVISERSAPFRVLSLEIPYTTNFVTYFNFAMLLGGLSIFYNRKVLLLGSSVFVFLLYAMLAICFISPIDFFILYRINVYSVPLFMSFPVILILRYGKLWQKNITLLGGVILLALFIRADFMVQKIWLLGNQSDERMISRVNNELLPKLDEGKMYRFATLGGMHGRQKFANVRFVGAVERERIREYYGYDYFLEIFNSSSWFLYEPRNPIVGNFTSYLIRFFANNEYFDKDMKANTEPMRSAQNPNAENIISIITRMKPYPHPSFLYVDDMDIIMLLDESGNRKAMQMFFGG